MPGYGHYDTLNAGAVNTGNFTAASGTVRGTFRAGALNTDILTADYIQTTNRTTRTVDIIDRTENLQGRVNYLEMMVADMHAIIEGLQDKIEGLEADPSRKYIELDGKHLFWLLEGGE